MSDDIELIPRDEPLFDAHTDLLPDFQSELELPGVEVDDKKDRVVARLRSFSPPPPLLEPVIPPLLPPPRLLPEYVANGVMNNNLLMKKRKEAKGKVTPFVTKIWAMVNDPANSQYISWSPDGLSFQVFHREQFMRTILPRYFKHGNFASFVRQLNMYGWHKVQDVNNGSLAKDDLSDEVLKFENPDFIRGREDLLERIVRNKGALEELAPAAVNVPMLMGELEQLKRNQMAIMEDVRRIRKDNQTLWNESFAARERSRKQSETLERIVKFIAAVYGSAGATDSVRARPRLMLMPTEGTLVEELPKGAEALELPLPALPEMHADASFDFPELNRLLGLEQSIQKQGQALLQVQDWIQTLAKPEERPPQLDDFDVDDFLSGHLDFNDTHDKPDAKHRIEEVDAEPRKRQRT